jgi:hypothetical protein
LTAPEKTSMTITYTDLKWSEIWSGCAHLQPIGNTAAAKAGLFFLYLCTYLAINLFLCLHISLGAIVLSAAIFSVMVRPFLIFSNTASVILPVKTGLPCRTTISSEGITEQSGPLRITFPWHKINTIERIGNILYFKTAGGGIHVPVSAFNDDHEADEFYALSVKHKAQNSSVKIAPTASTTANNAVLASHVPDPDFVLKSIQAEEERLWKEIEQKHREAQKQSE